MTKLENLAGAILAASDHKREQSLILDDLQLVANGKLTLYDALKSINFEDNFTLATKRQVGHFYSPNPSADDRELAIKSKQLIIGDGSLPSYENHLELAEEFLLNWEEFPFTENASNNSKGFRYYWNNGAFTFFDSIALFAILGVRRPKRIIEIGSGHTTRLILDSIDFHSLNCTLKLIQPYPHTLRSIFSKHEIDGLDLVVDKILNVDLDIFDTLTDGDLLFIDSSHVLKHGSDVAHEFCHIFPRLQKGVLVHLHDIFWPYSYPNHWIRNGRFDWNESYLLKILLQNSYKWKPTWFNSFFFEQLSKDPARKLLFDKLMIKQQGQGWNSDQNMRSGFGGSCYIEAAC